MIDRYSFFHSLGVLVGYTLSLVGAGLCLVTYTDHLALGRPIEHGPFVVIGMGLLVLLATRILKRYA